MLSVEDDLRNLHLTTTLLPLHWLLLQSHHTRTFCPGAPACPDAGQVSVFLTGLGPLEISVLTLWSFKLFKFSSLATFPNTEL